MIRSCHGFGIVSKMQCHQYVFHQWTFQSRSISSRRSSANSSDIVNHAMNQWCQYIISMRSACDHALKKLIFALCVKSTELNRSTNVFAVFNGFHHFLSLITSFSSINSSDLLRCFSDGAFQNRWTYEYREAYNVQYFEFFMNSSWFKNSFDFRTRDKGLQNNDLKSVKLNVVIGANESSSAPYSWR